MRVRARDRVRIGVGVGVTVTITVRVRVRVRVRNRVRVRVRVWVRFQVCAPDGRVDRPRLVCELPREYGGVVAVGAARDGVGPP